MVLDILDQLQIAMLMITIGLGEKQIRRISTSIGRRTTVRNTSIQDPLIEAQDDARKSGLVRGDVDDEAFLSRYDASALSQQSLL